MYAYSAHASSVLPERRQAVRDTMAESSTNVAWRMSQKGAAVGSILNEAGQVAIRQRIA
jgi:hypothetical protein